MNAFHLPVAAVAFGFLLGCGGFTFTELYFMCSERLLLCSIGIGYYIVRKQEN
jgi:hypothetical protein